MMPNWTFNEHNIMTEQINFIRSNVTDPNNRATEFTDTFVATAGQTEFTLTKILSSSSKLLYVKTVTVDGTELNYGEGYTAQFGGTNNGKVNLVTGADVGVTVSIKYGYGANSIAYPGFPRVDLGIEKYPRIAVMLLANTEIISASRFVLQSDIRLSIVFLGENTYQLDTLIAQLRDAYKSSPEFYYLRFVTPTNIANLSMSEDNTSDVVMKVMEMKAPFNLEKL